MARAKRASGAARPPTDRVLELTTRKGESVGYVRIDDRTYELANPSHFGLRSGGEIWRSIERIAALEALAEPSETDEREYRERLERVTKVALPELEAAIMTKLTTGQLADLVVSFFALVAASNPRLNLLVRRSASAGTTPSPNSSAGTAAT
jgi:hypothetical protein